MSPLIDTIGGESSAEAVPDSVDKQLISLVQEGLPLSERPFRDIAMQLGMSESRVIQRIETLQQQGLIKRFGVIVRHHELGFRANAMLVWDIPDDIVHEVAHRMKEYPFVTLCYRRPRILPHWPFNLFCMIHGKERTGVLKLVDFMIEENRWQDYRRDILFSKRRFKQRGACITVDKKGTDNAKLDKQQVA